MTPIKMKFYIISDTGVNFTTTTTATNNTQQQQQIPV